MTLAGWVRRFRGLGFRIEGLVCKGSGFRGFAVLELFVGLRFKDSGLLSVTLHPLLRIPAHSNITKLGV